jgi:hypothetical protein
VTRQEALLRLALRERGLAYDGLEIDHKNGRSRVNGYSLGVVYPDSFFAAGAALMGGPKPMRFFFQGDPGQQREGLLEPWREPIGQVRWSLFGRDKTRKDQWDRVYFGRLADAEFGLCPHHPEWLAKGWGPAETMWTYRFIDCVLVGTIPVLFRATPLGPEFVEGFTVAWDDDATFVYDRAAAAENRVLAERRFRLP